MEVESRVQVQERMVAMVQTADLLAARTLSNGVLDDCSCRLRRTANAVEAQKQLSGSDVLLDVASKSWMDGK